MSTTYDVLAAIDKAGLIRWQQALDALGFHDYEIHCETLMLPHLANTWSLAWNGREGFVRSGKFEGAATDCGDHENAPLSLHLMLEEAKNHNREPDSIAVYISSADEIAETPSSDIKDSDIKTIDVKKWSQELGLPVRLAGTWDWRKVHSNTGISLTRKQQPWRVFTTIAARLQPAVWILCAMLVLHASALVIDWSSLANEQHALRQQMESRFRAVFPDAIAVTDPALQMRRKLSEAHDASGQADSSNFLSMIEPVAAAMKELPAGAVHTVSYENGRMTLELSTTDNTIVKHITTQLLQSGMSVETHSEKAAVILTVRSS